MKDCPLCMMQPEAVKQTENGWIVECARSPQHMMTTEGITDIFPYAGLEMPTQAEAESSWDEWADLYQ